jgi:hypothetical protein
MAAMKHEKTSAAVQWLFRCQTGRWTWRACAKDGFILAGSEERFESLAEAMRDAEQNGFSPAVGTGRARS